jgi:nitric oxide reductase subunit B
MAELERLSPWWKHSLILTLIIGFTILSWLAVRTYQDAPPIPDRVLTSAGETLLTRSDVLTGQQTETRRNC